MHASKATTTSEELACQHCGALVYSDSKRCPQCGKFPIRLHRCPQCGCIASGEAERCWKCSHVFEPGGDYL
jgi:RNA polymerase subunit RPABC4/transcription elongation factor Spt4